MSLRLLVLAALATGACSASDPLPEAHPDSYDRGQAELRLRGERVTVETALVDFDFFDALEAQPALGRTFTENEAVPVMIVAHGLWLETLRGRANSVGTSLQLDGEDTMILGIMPEGFDEPPGVDLWLLRPPSGNR